MLLYPSLKAWSAQHVLASDQQYNAVMLLLPEE
jgi:hypothetical protein